MARIILEGSATLNSIYTYKMTNAQTILSAEIFVSDTAGAPPSELSGAARNQWLLDRVLEKLVVYQKSETERLSRQRKFEVRRTTEEAEIAVEINY